MDTKEKKLSDAGVPVEASYPDATSKPLSPQIAPKDPSLTSDKLVSTKVNEKYHDELLALLKVYNNNALNNIYYRTVPKLNKTALTNTDTGQRQDLLPETLLKSLPPKDPTVDYYQQMHQLELANKVMHQQIRKLLSERHSIYQRVNRLQMQKREEDRKTQREPGNLVPVTGHQPISLSGPSRPEGYSHHSLYPHRKRYRRTAGEIERRFRCPVENCMKAYGCEGSLNQHIKIKHPELYISQSKMPQGSQDFESKEGDDIGESAEFSEQP